MSELAEFAVTTLKEYAHQKSFGCRNTSDLSQLEEWLLVELFRVKNLTIPDVSNSVICPNCNERCNPVSLGAMCDKCYCDI